MSAGRFDADVAVVGYGPSGAIAASLLGKAGVRTVALERDKNLTPGAPSPSTTGRCGSQELGVAERAKQDMDVMPAVSWKTYRQKLVFPPRAEARRARPPHGDDDLPARDGRWSARTPPLRRRPRHPLRPTF